MLNCTENHFTPKLWRFHPEPIAQWEQIGTILCFMFLGGFPLIVELYGLWAIFQQGGGNIFIVSFSGIILGTVLTLLLFYLTFYMLYCPHCINFSCVFNKVPRQYIDEYLRRNPSMQRVWKNYKREKT